MLQFKRWIVTLFCLVALVAGLGFVKFTQIQAAIAFGESFPETSETVQALVATKTSWQPQLEVVGEITALQTLELRNELEGLITEVNFKSGEAVEAGEVLMRLDATTEQAQLDAIQAQIELAKLDVKRFGDLLQSNAGSREQLDRANAQLAVYQANARALQATITKKTLTAPFSGTAGIHQWEVGSFLPSNTRVTTLVGDLSEVWVDFSLPQKHSGVTQGSQIQVRAPDISDTVMAATIIAVEQRINSGSRSLQVRASMDNSSAKLKPGTFVQIQIASGQPQDAFALPTAALRFDSFGSYVFVLNKDDAGQWRAARRPVELLSREYETAYIRSGLDAGETIATVGSAKLYEGLLVFVAEDN